MQFTIGLPTDHVDRADEFVSGEAVTACASAAEAAGFDACFVTDHPAPDAKWLAGGGHHALDPFVALSFAAAATTRLRLQTHILVLPYRNPLLTAKSVLSLDVLSGGRVILGVAPGYLKPEFAALGVDFDERNELTDEAIDVMRQVWTDGEIETVGRHFRTRGTVMRPRSPQVPHPPIWVGGNSTAAMRRAAERGQGWVPFPNPGGLTSRVRTPELSTLDELGPPHRDPARARRRDRARRADRHLLLAVRRRSARDRRRAPHPRSARRDVGGAPPPERDHPRRLDRRGPAARRCRDRSVPRSTPAGARNASRNGAVARLRSRP